MAKRKTKKTTANQTGLKQTLILLGIIFSSVLFIIKLVTGRVGWFEVFAPVVIAFFIVFLLSVMKSILRKI
jgi:hypothetical protein